MPEITKETEVTILPEFDNEKWYNTPRPARNQKTTKSKNATKNSPNIVQPVTPMFQEITPANGVPETGVPMITQEDEILQTIPRGLGFPMTMPIKPPPPPRRSTRTKLPHFNRSNAAIFAAQEALYQILAHAMEAPKLFTPRSLETATLTVNENNIDLQNFCGGVTHPTTGETITSYRKLLKIPSLRDIWTKAMCKELGNISQGWGNEKRH